mmetsp:Transcript_143254/g.445283  ORF Transcript_143254/g.445283 Transcript_143254/m.445283 type:complete len:233 (+) Transcript_143254:540-1238(+)
MRIHSLIVVLAIFSDGCATMNATICFRSMEPDVRSPRPKAMLWKRQEPSSGCFTTIPSARRARESAPSPSLAAVLELLQALPQAGLLTLLPLPALPRLLKLQTLRALLSLEVSGSCMAGRDSAPALRTRPVLRLSASFAFAATIYRRPRCMPLTSNRQTVVRLMDRRRPRGATSAWTPGVPSLLSSPGLPAPSEIEPPWRLVGVQSSAAGLSTLCLPDRSSEKALLCSSLVL